MYKERYHLNAGLVKCFWCGEAVGIAIPKKMSKKEEYKEYINDYEPCDKCQEQWKLGVAAIEVSEISNGLFPIQKNLYPTGRMWVLKKETIDKILDKNTEKVILITPDFAENIGLNKPEATTINTEAKDVTN